MRVVSLGDLVLDVVVRLRRPLAIGGDAPSSISLSAGGQAANVAAWVASLGGEARWLGKRADDEAGRIAAGRLQALGVELTGPVTAEGNGVVVSLVAPGGERTMCPDRGVAVELRADDVRVEHFAGWDWLHVSGYALLEQTVREAALRAAALAREQGLRVSVDLASWSGIANSGPDAFRDCVAGLAPDVVFANEEEERVVGGPIGGPAWIVKRGAAGASFAGEERPAVPVPEVVDTTGAGDALAAGWLVGGPDLAMRAAALCVGRAGSMPAAAA
jgi:sugar/nucleoside kinase (ribokinase family)